MKSRSPAIRVFGLTIMTALVVANCSKGTPTSPSGTAPPPPPDSGSVQVQINPNPVPFSGVPVTDTPDCATLKNTWYYDQVFKNNGATSVTFTARVDSFDGFVVNNFNGLQIAIPAAGSLALHARWCSGNPTAHTALSTFSGVDDKGSAVNLTTPTIHLMAP